MQEEIFVKSLYTEKAKNDSNSQDLANSLNILSKTVFGELNRFIFELLQNADDSPISQGDSTIDVEFRILKNYLIFSHSGKHFSNNDVKGISRVGSRESNKVKDIEKTGYKGIGFKSIFGSSDFVQIVSKNFSFRFDKNFSLWEGRKDYPWQVIPIWTPEHPTEVTPFLDDNLVNTIIQVKNSDRIKEEIEKVFNDCQIVLFLRHVRQITFFDYEKLVFRIEKQEAKNGVRQLFKNDQLVNSWLIQDFIVSVDEALQAKLRRLSDEECPPKLKEAKSTKITFAGYVENDRLFQVENALLYCYLPTKVSKGFPFIINADFITNAERTQFLNNEWNNFLFEEIAYLQFEWFKELQETPVKFQIAALIKTKFADWKVSNIEQSFNNGFDSGINEVEFLPMQSSKSLLTVIDSVVDTTGFSGRFGARIISDYLNTQAKLVDQRVEYPEILINQVGVHEFGIEDLCDLLISNRFLLDDGPARQNSINLIQFLYEKTSENKNLDWIEYLKKTKFLLNNNGNLNTPKEIFFPGTVQTQVSNIININHLNLYIYQFCDNNPHIFKWLNELGVKEPSNLEVLRKSIYKIISEEKVNASNVISVGRFVFNVFKGGQLTDADYQFISTLKLSTQKGLRLPNETYLPDIYGPELKIESILSDANFVSNNYPEDPSQLDDWKTFLVRIGVKENITISVDPSVTQRAKFIAKHTQTEAYFKWLDKEEHYAPIYRPYTHQHSISNFTFITFYQYLSVYSFSKVFWKLVMNNWNTLLERCSKTQYHYRGGSTIVPSFFQYYISVNPSIPATDGKCYTSKDIYVPSLKNVIGDFFPVADFEGYVTKEQAEFLGFKRNILLDDCFIILKKLENYPINAELNKQVFAIYEQIIKKRGDLDKSAFAKIRRWRNTGKFLAQNNTFQRIDNLYCFSIRELTAPVNSENFIKMPPQMKFDDLLFFCQIFEIPIVTYEQLSFVSEEEKIESELQIKLKEKIKYLAVVFAHRNSDDQFSLFQNLLNKISQTNFYSAEHLSLVYTGEDSEEIYCAKIKAWYDKGNRFYYVGKWDSPLTLYSLSGSLCSYFKFRGMEREVALFLQLDEDEIYSWLCEKGYEIEDMVLYDISMPQNDNQSDSVEEKEVEYEGSLVVEEFKPEVEAKDVDVSQVKVATKVAETINLNPISTINELNSNSVRIDIGRWSEEFVYNYLMENNKYSEIIWENKNGECGKPYDFLVIENGLTKFLEVKGTPSRTKEIIYLSRNEWKLMFDKGESYSIYRLYNAGTKNPNIEIFDYPAKLIREGVILPNPITIQV